MTVYVDALRAWGWRLHGKSVRSCHLVADCRAELVAFAEDLLGLNPKWIQEAPRKLTHFDLTAGKRRKALLLGARELTTKEMAARVRRARVPVPAPASTGCCCEHCRRTRER